MSAKLSYKFQRLREQLREAIASGEFKDKLPGERILAKRFGVNAKTLSKALTDLAAEGLLDRNIGRGTFVKTATPAASRADRWLLLTDSEQANSSVIQQLQILHPETQVVTDPKLLRPSLLSGVSAVVDFALNTPDAIFRDLIVRNMAVVLVGREPKTYSVNAVLVDRQLGTSLLARDLMMRGHRRFLAVERESDATITTTIRQVAEQICPEASVDRVLAREVIPALAGSAATAVICESRTAAVTVAEALKDYLSLHGPISLAAVGSGNGQYPCSGYFVGAEQKAQTIGDLITNAGTKRPVTLWLTGAFVDRQTIHSAQGAYGQQSSSSLKVMTA